MPRRHGQRDWQFYVCTWAMRGVDEPPASVCIRAALFAMSKVARGAHLDGLAEVQLGAADATRVGRWVTNRPVSVLGDGVGPRNAT